MEHLVESVMPKKQETKPESCLPLKKKQGKILKEEGSSSQDFGKMKKIEDGSNDNVEMTKEVVAAIQKSLWPCRGVEVRINKDKGEHGWEYNWKVKNYESLSASVSLVPLTPLPPKPPDASPHKMVIGSLLNDSPWSCLFEEPTLTKEEGRGEKLVFYELDPTVNLMGVAQIDDYLFIQEKTFLGSLISLGLAQDPFVHQKEDAIFSWPTHYYVEKSLPSLPFSNHLYQIVFEMENHDELFSKGEMEPMPSLMGCRRWSMKLPRTLVNVFMF